MRTIVSAIVISLSTLLVACATTGTSLSSSSGALGETVSTINPRAVTDAEKTKVLQEGKVLFKEISGSWISITTGLSSEFYLKDVKVLGSAFVAEFYFGSARALSCSLKEKVSGAYDGIKLEFELVDVGCQKPFYNRMVFDVKDGKGAYFGRRGQQFGWFVPVKVE